MVNNKNYKIKLFNNLCEIDTVNYFIAKLLFIL